MPLVDKNLNNWEINGNSVCLSHEYLKKGLDKNNKWGKFKKITGTRFSSIFGLSKYNSPFKTWMGMTNLYKDDMDPTLSEVGNIIEPFLRDYAAKYLNHDYIMHNPIEIGFDAFSNNEIFGGIPDGEPINSNGKVDYSNSLPMLEIKTTSIDKLSYKSTKGIMRMQKDENNLPIISKAGEKRKEWFDSNDHIVIPIEYQFQLALYLYLRNIKKGMFVISFLKGDDYSDPGSFECDTHEIRMVEFNIESIAGLEKYIDRAKEWYCKYITGGISPEMTNDDKIWLEKERKNLQ